MEAIMKKILKFIVLICAIIYSLPSFALNYISHIPDNPKQALIMIHGWRQNGDSMQWMTEALKKDFPDMAFYYPTAPDNAPGGGYEWFVIPIIGADMSDIKYYEIMMSSALNNISKIHSLIEEIHKTQAIEYKDIHIAGFSQGGFMSILSGITSNKTVGKVISFSGVPILFTHDFKSNGIRSIPDILIIQGDNDKVIPADSYALTDKTLRSVNINADVKIIKNMPHTIDDMALEIAKEFLMR